MNLAATACERPGCPSDTAKWQPIYINQVFAGNRYQCVICSLDWIHWT